MSQTLMDERFRENYMKAGYEASKVAIITTISVSASGYLWFSDNLQFLAAFLFALIVLISGLSILLEKFLLYYYDSRSVEDEE